MTAPTQLSPEAVAAANVYQAQQEQLRAQLLAAILAVWAATSLTSPLPSFDTIFNYVRMMIPPTLAAQRAMSAMVVAELQRQTQAPISVNANAIIGHNLRGVPVEQVYMRSYQEVNRLLNEGYAPEYAFRIGQERLAKTAVTDLQLAQTHTVRDFATQLQDRRPDVAVGYRRVLSNKPNHCALCILASTQRYHHAELMPIHPGCGCGVEMILGHDDPARVLDESRLGDIHAIIARDLGQRYADRGGGQRATSLAHYRDILVTESHGELGPVLAVRDHHFKGPGEPPVHEIGHIAVNPPDEAA
jgi:hypothetical protein